MTSQHFPFFEAHICLPHHTQFGHCKLSRRGSFKSEHGDYFERTKNPEANDLPPASEGVNVIYPGVFEQRLDIHGIFVFTNALPPGGMAMETHPKCVRVSIRTKTSLAVSARLGCVSIGCRIRSKRNHYVRYPVCSS